MMCWDLAREVPFERIGKVREDDEWTPSSGVDRSVTTARTVP